MYGLLSQAYKNYRIKNTTKEGFWTSHTVKNYMSWPSRGTYYILEILLTILAILCLYDCFIVKGWDAWLLGLLLVLFFVPFIGDVLALAIIIYWITTVRSQSMLLSKFGVSV